MDCLVLQHLHKYLIGDEEWQLKMNAIKISTNCHITGLLTEQQEYAVRNLLERLQALLATATKKRPLHPPNLLIGKSGKANGQIPSAAEEKAKLKQVIHSFLTSTS